ncbi:MAG TPA: diguanylate cyclase [Abditibacteriaceae bacterium]|nr:diguanylate cyclase [Abditibacteriaceae bacterium]
MGNAVALRAAPKVERSSAKAAAAKVATAKRSVGKTRMKNGRRAKAAASSTRTRASSSALARLRNRPQVVILAAALGFISVAIALITITRPRTSEPKEDARLETDDVVRLRTMLEFERARQKEHEELTRAMTMSATDVQYVMHPVSGNIDWFGPFDTLLGFSRNAFPRTIEAWAENIHPEESEGIVALYADSCRGACDFKAEYRMRHRNGTYRDWVQRGRPIFDDHQNLLYFVGACTDVTERNRLQNKLRQSEEQLQRVLETSSDAMVLCDREGRPSFANSAAESLLGVDRNQIVGKTFDDGNWSFADADGTSLPASQTPLARVLEAEENVDEIEYSIEQEDGKKTRVSVNAAPLQDDDGQISGAVLCLTDITSRKPENEMTQQTFLMQQALLDPLTGLANRVLFRDRLEHALAKAERAHTPVALLCLKLDNFRFTNENLGTTAGDELLKVMAQRLLQLLRTSDTAARTGDDEFAIVLENTRDAANIHLVTNRVLESLLEPVCIENENVFALPCIGVALSVAGCTPDELLSWSGQAMEQARQNGKGRYEMYEPGKNPKVQSQQSSAPETQQPPTPEATEASSTPMSKSSGSAWQLLMDAREARRNIRHDTASIYVADGAIGGGVSGAGLANGFVIGDIAEVADSHHDLADDEAA